MDSISSLDRWRLICLLFVFVSLITSRNESSLLATTPFDWQAYDSLTTPEDRLGYLHLWIRDLRYDSTSIPMTTQALELLTEITNDSLKGVTWYLHGHVLRFQFKYDSADVSYQLAADAFAKAGDGQSQIGAITRMAYSYLYRENDGQSADSMYQMAIEIAQNHVVDSVTMLSIYQGRGNALMVQSRYSEALEQFLIGERYLQTTNYPWLKTFNLNLAGLYQSMKRYEESQARYQKILDIATAREDYDGMAFANRSMGHIAVNREDYLRAETYYLAAIEAFEKSGDSPRIAYTLSDLIAVYRNQNLWTKVYETAKQSLEFSRKTGLKYEQAWALAQLGSYYNAQNQAHLGLSRCLEAQGIMQGENHKEVFELICECLIESNEKLGLYKDALSIYKTLQHFKDSLNVQSQEREIAQVEARFQIEKANELALLERENQRVAYESILVKQRSIHNLLGLGLVALAIVLFLIWKAYRQRRHANQVLQEKNETIEHALNEKQLLLQEIHHRVKNNLQVISSLLSLQSNHVKDRTALEALNEGRNRVLSMVLIHQDLYRHNDLRGINVRHYLEKLIRGLFESYNIHNDLITLELDIEDLNCDIDTLIPLGLVVNELVTNALKYAFPDGHSGVLRVSLREVEDVLELVVEDDGIGIGEYWQEGTGSFGYELIHSFKQSLEADLAVEGDHGTQVTMRIRDYQISA